MSVLVVSYRDSCTLQIVSKAVLYAIDNDIVSATADLCYNHDAGSETAVQGIVWGCNKLT